MQSYKELVVWQKATNIVLDVYATTKDFPREEIYGLTSQLRRCAVSISSNIAEGQGRATKGEFVQFLCHARGSLFELETQSSLLRTWAISNPSGRNTCWKKLLRWQDSGRFANLFARAKP